MTYRLAVLNRDPTQEIELEDGRYSFGARADDDIQVPELGQVRMQAILSEGLLTVLNCSDTLFLDGKQVESLPLDVGPRHVLSFNGAHFAFAEDDSEWPELPEIQLNEAVDVETAAQPVRVISAKETLPIGVFGAFIASIVMVGLFMYGALLAPKQVVDPRDQLIQNASESLNLLVQSDPLFDGVLINERLDGAVVVTGFVVNEQAYELLAKTATLEEQLTGGFVRNDSFSRRALSVVLDDMLANYPVHYDMSIDQIGKTITISISGIDSGTFESQILQEQIDRIGARMDPWLVDLQVNLVDWDVLVSRVQTVLLSSPISEGFNFELKGRIASLTGRHALAASGRVKSITEEVQAIVAPFLPLQATMTEEARLDFTVDAVILGQQPVALVTERGQLRRLAVGDRVAGRAIIRKVEASGIQVELQGDVYFIPLTG